jgi:Bifunctional DNA primase/polymerase, N-terminal
VSPVPTMQEPEKRIDPVGDGADSKRLSGDQDRTTVPPGHIARSYAELGLAVHPCDGKVPLVKWRDESTTDLATIAAWWERWPDASIGVDCGKSGLVVVDLDVKDGIDGIGNWKRHIDGKHVPATYSVRTPSGGLHHWFRDPEGKYRNSAGLIAPGVDIRAVGGFVVAPGSPDYTRSEERS